MRTKIIAVAAGFLAAAGSSLAYVPAALPTLRSAAHTRLCTSNVRTMMQVEGGGRRKAIGTALATGFGIAAGLQTTESVANAASADPEIMTITTTAGDMVFEFWPEVAPETVKNFKKLAKTGYFDGQAFHRIIKGFVIQGGDPNTKVGYGPEGTLKGADGSKVRTWGTGGPGYNIKAEFNDRKHEFGVLSMARSANPDSAGSQFFVCLGPLKSLDNKYTTFGKMIKGDDVLQTLGSAKTVKGDYPFQRQGIEKVTISPAE